MVASASGFAHTVQRFPLEGMVRNGLPDACAAPSQRKLVLRDGAGVVKTARRAGSFGNRLTFEHGWHLGVGSSLCGGHSSECSLPASLAKSIGTIGDGGCRPSGSPVGEREALVRVRPYRKCPWLFGAAGRARTRPKTRSPGKQRATLCWQRQSVRYGFVSGAKP